MSKYTPFGIAFSNRDDGVSHTALWRDREIAWLVMASTLDVVRGAGWVEVNLGLGKQVAISFYNWGKEKVQCEE